MKTVCYHHNDYDGRCAAAIVRLHFDGDAECVESFHHKPFQLDKADGADVVFLVDFTPKEDIMADLCDRVDDVVWIDHHDRPIKDLPDYSHLSGLRSSGTPSGCMLTWQYLTKGLNPPLALVLIDKFDTWNFNRGSVVEQFVNGLKTKDTSAMSPFWNKVLCHEGIARTGANKLVEHLCHEGRVVGRSFVGWTKDYLDAYGFETELDGLKGYVVNIAMLGSLAFDSVDMSEYDFIGTFTHDGRHFSVGLYQAGNPEVDLSKIASKHGGGGHKGAAGFQCEKLPFKVLD